MSQYWSAVVHGLIPYVPGEQPRITNLIKLNTNENPYPPSPHVLAAIKAELGDDAASLRLYPDPYADVLTSALAEQFGVERSQIFVGNSSDEVLAHVFPALLKHDRPLLFPDITYSFYPSYCRLYNIQFRTLPLTEDFVLRASDYTAEPNGGIIFPNPNAPTGRVLPLADIETVAAANPDTPVVIDEAYVDFGGASAIPLVARYPNLLVVQTLSKSRALAGLRIGFAIGQAPLIEALERVKNSFNSYPLDRLALVGSAAALADRDYFARTCQAIIASREHLTAELTTLGFDVLPSAANFVFARHPAHDAATLAQQLRERAILVRHFKQARIDQFLRITIGTEAECATLVTTLRDLL